MKALAKLKKEPGIWMTEVEKPVQGDNDLLVKILKTAICGTDIHIYRWDEWAQKTVPVPMVTGHEFVGEVVGIGKNVKGFKIGDRVSAEGHLICGTCRNCRAGKHHWCRNVEGIGYDCTGCFSEYFTFPAFNAIKIPDGISDEIASILDPLGNAAHTALSFNLAGEDVLITGAGPVGLMAATIALKVGAGHVVITDISEYRLELARQLGVKYAINATQTDLRDVMQALKITEGFGVGLEMSGNSQAFNQIIDCMSYGGNVALLGILPDNTGIEWSKVIFHSLTLKGIYGREMFETWRKMISLLQNGLNVAPVITHHFHIDDYQKAFEVMDSGYSGKVILDWI